MTQLERLRQAAELLPLGASLTITREALLEALLGGSSVEGADAPPTGDLSVADLAAHFRRAGSTIRTWLEDDRFEGAYHLPASGKLSKNGKVRVGAWRVPAAALEKFSAALRQPRPAGVDLGSWRRYRRAS